MEEIKASNFIHDFIDEDLKEGVYDSKPVFRLSLTVICILVTQKLFA